MDSSGARRGSDFEVLLYKVRIDDRKNRKGRRSSRVRGREKKERQRGCVIESCGEALFVCL